MHDSLAVVSGTDAYGRSGVVREQVVQAPPGAAPHSLWRCDDWPVVPNAGGSSTRTDFPAERGVWVVQWSLSPYSTATSGAEFVETSPDAPGFHATRSVDVNVVVAGRATIEFDDGDTRTLGPGDSVVVNGDRHAWHNRHAEVVVVVSTIVGARTQTGASAALPTPQEHT